MAKLTVEVVQKEENENKEGESSPMIQLGNLKILQQNGLPEMRAASLYK